MQKLYSAIGYSENEVITPFPKEVNSIELAHVHFMTDVLNVKCTSASAILLLAFLGILRKCWLFCCQNLPPIKGI